MKTFVSALFAVVLLASCRDLKEPVFDSIEGVQLNQLNFTNPTVKLNTKYFNPNKFSARLKEAEGDAWIDSSLLGHFTVDTIISAPANSEFIVPVNLRVNMSYILQNSASLMAKEEVFIRIAGTAKAGKGGFYKNFPITYQGRQKVSELFR
jgi:LEA14-like dessication related protein